MKLRLPRPTWFHVAVNDLSAPSGGGNQAPLVPYPAAPSELSDDKTEEQAPKLSDNHESDRQAPELSDSDGLLPHHRRMTLSTKRILTPKSNLSVVLPQRSLL
jgi:hypothetical protein